MSRFTKNWVFYRQYRLKASLGTKFLKLWGAAVISGTCVAAHDNAATWMMNISTGSPLLLSLMSTVASLAFFLFTLPAGALADRVDRQKLVCTINVCMAATAFALAVLGWIHVLNPYLILGGVFFSFISKVLS